MKRLKGLTVLLMLTFTINAQAKEHRYDYYDNGIPHVAPKNCSDSVPCHDVIYPVIAKDTSKSLEQILPTDPHLTATSYTDMSHVKTGEMIVYATSVVFGDKSQYKISWGSGKAVFKGDADKGARALFKFLKPMIDDYIKYECETK